MQESKVNTMQVPQTGASPALLIIAAAAPMRVVVRNIGGTTVLIAHDDSTLQTNPPNLAGTFQLPAGTSEVFVLQPKQRLLAASSGAAGLVSIAASEALPTRWMES